MREADLVQALEDDLFALREQLGEAAYPKRAQDYLNDWAARTGLLRKFYKPGTDEAQFDLTPATEKAIMAGHLTERPFVGTESRLLTLFALLEQISAGTEPDPARRLRNSKRAQLDADIAREAGEVPLLDDTSIRSVFSSSNWRELLADFREVEHSFRQLDRSVRGRSRCRTAAGVNCWTASWASAIPSPIRIGRSFRAFWDFLMPAVGRKP